MANWATPLLPIHILWINLVTDSLPALALSVDPAEKDVMNRKPIDSRQGFMTRPFAIRLALEGLMIALLTLTAYQVGLRTGGVDAAQTMTFATLAFSQIAIIFGIRSGNHSAFRGMFNNKYLLGAVAVVAALMLVVLLIPGLEVVFHTVPLTGSQWWWVVGLSLAPIAFTEIGKLLRKWFKR